MATHEDNTTENGPALALSELYEANDLLNLFREHSEETTAQTQLSSGQWTLTCEIKRRLDSAIAHLDGAVKEPADAPDPAEATRENLRVIRQQTDALPDGPLKDAANDLADGIEHDLDDLESPLNEALYDYAEQLAQLSSMVFVTGEADRTVGMTERDMEAVMRIVERDAKRLSGLVEDVAGKVRKLEGQP